MVDRAVKGQWELARKAENESVYESLDTACWYCGDSLEGLNLIHHIGSNAWHLRCVVRELDRRREYGRA